MPKLSILINSFSFLLLLIFFKIKQNNINWLYSEKYSGYSLKQGILIFFGCFAFVVYLVPIIEIGTLLNEKRSVISVAVSGIIFLIICFLSLLYIQKNHLFKEKNEIYKSMILEQKVYYESILKRETETKQFRHDIKNHLLCMKQLIEEKQYLNVKDYMDDMIGKVEKLGSYRQTGNKIADIIISDIWKRTENIKLDWNGMETFRKIYR